MSFNINDFKAVLSSRGYQRNNNFAVNISPPPNMQMPSIVQDLPLLCNSVNIPGVSLTTDEFRHKGYGLAEKRPIATTFEDIDITIIADGRGEILKFFQDWDQLIFNRNDEDTNNGGVEFFGYPMDYYGSIEIYMYDITSQLHTTYTMSQAYPVRLGAVQFSWQDTDTLMLISVAFAYRNFKINTSHSGAVSNLSTGNVRNINAVNTLITNPDPSTIYRF